MKKTWMAPLCFCVVFQGCTNKTSSYTSASSVSYSRNVWHVLADVNADKISDLVPFSYSKLRSSDLEAIICANIDTEQNEHAVLITSGDTQSVYDYDGNLLYTLPVAISETKNAEGIVNASAHTSDENNYMEAVYAAQTSDGSAYCLESDFKTYYEINPDRLIFHPYDGDQYYNTVAIMDGKVGILSNEEDENGYITEKYMFTEYTDHDLPQLFITSSIDEDCNVVNEVICDDSMEIVSVVPAKIYEKQSGLFMNGFYPVYQEKDGEKKIAMVDASDGKEISEYVYTDVGYFSDGYCPVKNDEGKWAYIDTSGNMVSEFMFDGASSLCEGKAWIVKDGKAGVLNLKDALKENDLLSESVFSQTDSDIVESTSENKEDPVIGSITIKASSINIRKGAGTEYDTNGSVSSAETYDVYQIEESDDYIWYRIGNDMWIAGNDEWVSFVEE